MYPPTQQELDEGAAEHRAAAQVAGNEMHCSQAELMPAVVETASVYPPLSAAAPQGAQAAAVDQDPSAHLQG